MQSFPPTHAEAFRHLARTWAATVTVVTAIRREGTGAPDAPRTDGFTATAFLTLSLEPPLVGVAVERGFGADALLADAAQWL